MIELFGLQLGTVFQGGTLLTLLLLLGVWWVRGIPDRGRVKNEGKVIDNAEAEKIRTDYAAQIKDFRAEVHGYRNELAAIAARLTASESVSRQRSDRINNMMFIIRLLISELRRLDPTSIIVKQAEAMLQQMEPETSRTNDALSVAEGAVADAEQTVVSATATVDEIKHAGNGNKK